MWIKHIITDNKFNIGFKYNPEQHKIVLGCHNRFHHTLLKIKQKFIPLLSKVKVSYPNQSTVRYEFWCPMHLYEKVINELREDDTITVLNVTNMGRVMR